MRLCLFPARLITIRLSGYLQVRRSNQRSDAAWMSFDCQLFVDTVYLCGRRRQAGKPLKALRWGVTGGVSLT